MKAVAQRSVAGCGTGTSAVQEAVLGHHGGEMLQSSTGLGARVPLEESRWHHALGGGEQDRSLELISQLWRQPRNGANVVPGAEPGAGNVLLWTWFLEPFMAGTLCSVFSSSDCHFGRSKP